MSEVRSAADCMREAIRLACEAVVSLAGGPFGAVIARQGEVVGRGWNRVTSTNDPTAHAEVVAIREACRRLRTFRLDDCEIYASCEPCPMCLGAIYWARIGRIWYAADRRQAAEAGFDDARFYEQIAQPPAQRALPTGVLMAEAGEEPFRKWQELAGRMEY